MNIERVRYFNKMSQEEYDNISRVDFTISELKEILDETRMPPIDREIARFWLIDGMLPKDIADKVFMDKRAVHKHLHEGVNGLPSIRQMLKDTLSKMTRQVIM